jgi:hypothetical protein
VTSYVRNESTEGSAPRGGNPGASEGPYASLDETNNNVDPVPPPTASEAIRRARAAWAPVTQQLSFEVGLDEEQGR